MGFYNHTAETERLLTENYERYYRLAYKLMRNQDDALDVVQESAYRAIKDCKGVRNKDYLSTWIYRIVVNTSLDMLRRKKKETPTEEMPETPTEDHYQDLDLKQMINRLDDKSRTVILLRYFEDLKLEEIADIVGENLNTVKARLYRTLKKLRLELEPESYEICKEDRRGRCRCHDCHYRTGQRHTGPGQCHGTDSGHWIHRKGGNLPHL